MNAPKTKIAPVVPVAVLHKKTKNMHDEEATRTGCDGTIEKMNCKCRLSYVKLCDIAMTADYTRAHLNVVTPAYSDDGRFQCDGCGGFFCDATPCRTTKALPHNQEVLPGHAYHCKHGFDFCDKCIVNAVPPARNMPLA